MSHPAPSTPSALRQPRTRQAARRRALQQRPVSLAAACLIGAAPASFALPQGAVPTFGQATVRQTAPGQLDIKQTTAKAGLDWTSFSIAAGERVNVQQPGRDSVLLNRVLGDNPSLIYGKLNSNGGVWLINPRGIVFGAGSRVDVGSLVASTLAISQDDINSGRLQLGRAGTAEPGSLEVDGQITAADGTVALVAPRITIGAGGRIEARRIGVAAAGAVELDLEGDGLIVFNARSDGLESRLAQLGNVLASGGGSIELRAAARAGIADTVLNLEGVVQARSLGMRDGRVVIDGGDSGITRVGGTVDASGLGAGERGGEVHVLGQRVMLDSGAAVDASGAVGGGRVLVGGDFQGKNPDVRNAEMLVVRPGATIAADATVSGDGGSVVMWSDQATRFHGQLTARGGVEGGHGGNAEVSGKQSLEFLGSADLSAARGRMGTLLLDPNDIVIETGGNNIAGNINFGGGGTTRVKAGTDAGGLGLLLQTTSVVLQADQTILVSNAVDGTGGDGLGSLTLQAGRDITINANVSANGISITANHVTGSRQPGEGFVTVPSGRTLNAGAGALSISNSGNAGTGANRIHQIGGNLSGATLSIDGDVSLTANSTWTLNSGTSSIASVISGSGNLTKAGAGTLVLSGSSGSYSGDIAVNAGILAAATSPGALGSSAGTTTTINGGKLEIRGVAIGEPLIFTSGSLASTGAASLSGAIALQADMPVDVPGTLLLSGVISGAGGLTKAGAGTLTLGDLNTYTGVTTVADGTLRAFDLTVASNASSLGDATSAVVLGDATHQGTLEYTGPAATFTRGLAIVAGVGGRLSNIGGEVLTVADGGVAAGGQFTVSGDTPSATTITSAISGNGGLTKSGTGTLTLSGDNSYSGGTGVTAGTLIVGHANALGSASAGTAVTSGATLQLSGFDIGAEALSLAGIGVGGAGALVASGAAVAGGSVTLAADTRVDSGATSLSLGGAVGGAFALTKIGAGSLTLAGANTYSGATNVNAGTLVATHASALGSIDAGTTVADGATLRISNAIIGAEALSLVGTGVGGGGALVGTGTSSLGGTLTLLGAATVDVASGAQLTLAGTVVGGAFNLDKNGTGTLVLSNAGNA
ncbi:autotransporter-associated beta strand repeat-containing protein, partial [Rubrivivax sp. A210]|uniref:autotransporter-associated beta strand repeat-containing protein n=1 Tax=Rubrivivax sp. A210 TaxID=2772301 RepID=UPI00191B73AD